MASSVEQVEVSRACVQDWSAPIRHWVYRILRKPSPSPHLPLDYKLHSVFIIRGMNCCKMLNILPWLYMLGFIWLKTWCRANNTWPSQINTTTKKNQPTTTTKIGEFPAVQWLRLCASNARGLGSILGQGTKILHAVWCDKQQQQQQQQQHSILCTGFLRVWGLRM